MWRFFFVPVSLLVMVAGVCRAADETRNAAPVDTPTLDEQTAKADEPAKPRGLPVNQWRYQFYTGRWWYWTADDRWSYFDGSRWRNYETRREYQRQPVDPALLRLEAKEGALGRKRWPKVAGRGGASLPMSGTRGSLGGAPTGSFTDPGGVPSAVNTSTGTPFGNGNPAGLGSRSTMGMAPEASFGGTRARSGDAGSGVGGGAVGGTSVTGGPGTGPAK